MTSIFTESDPRMTEKIKKFIEEFKKLENRETIKINLISETKTL